MDEKVDVQLIYENRTLFTKLSASEIEEISSDTKKYDEMCRNLMQQEMSKVGNSSSSFEPDVTSEGSSSSQTQEKRGKWTTAAIKLLLDIRLGMQPQFERPVCKKNKLWTRVSEMMSHEDYSFSGDECYSKYRNLLQTYKHNKEKRLKKTGEYSITY
ncbi:hypothetical protein FQR65_LT19476 [Abscondita terminalis]|nr:hypothetical protein FQR65_LT19476 [Abscondita terminalis]